MGLLYLSSAQKIALLNLEKTLVINIANNVIKGIEWTISGALIMVVAAPVLYASVSIVKKIIGYDKEDKSSQREDVYNYDQNQITEYNNSIMPELDGSNCAYTLQGAINSYSVD